MITPKIDMYEIPAAGLLALGAIKSTDPLGARDWVRTYSGLQPAEIAQLSTEQIWLIIKQVSQDVLNRQSKGRSRRG